MVTGDDELRVYDVGGGDPGFDSAWLESEPEADATLDDPVAAGRVGIEIGELVGVDRGEYFWRGVVGQDAADEWIGGFYGEIERESGEAIGVWRCVRNRGGGR